MNDTRYFGTYARFTTASNKESGALLGPDNIIGDPYSLVFHEQDGISYAWLQNRFGAEIGFLDAATSRQANIYRARGWNVWARLSFIAFTESDKGGTYWGEVALICYDPAYDKTFNTFADTLGKRLAEGVRPAVSLGKQEIDLLVEKGGQWTPSARVPLPKKTAGTIIMKQRMKLSEKVIEQGRRRNVGCYVLTWLIIIAFVCGSISCIIYLVAR